MTSYTTPSNFSYHPTFIPTPYSSPKIYTLWACDMGDYFIAAKKAFPIIENSDMLLQPHPFSSQILGFILRNIQYPIPNVLLLRHQEMRPTQLCIVCRGYENYDPNTTTPENTGFKPFIIYYVHNLNLKNGSQVALLLNKIVGTI